MGRPKKDLSAGAVLEAVEVPQTGWQDDLVDSVEYDGIPAYDDGAGIPIEDTDEGQDERRIARLTFERGRMIKHAEQTNAKRACIDIGDQIADWFRGHDSDLYGRARYLSDKHELDVDVDDIQMRHRQLNKGMQRMNLGNSFRKAYRNKCEDNLISDKCEGNLISDK